jgi:hypothetical protein
MELCGAKARTTGGQCRKQAGWGTDHFGQGRCRVHSGRPITHGRLSSIKRPAWTERIERFKADPDPLNLLDEVALLRAFVEDLIERWEAIYGPDGALMTWHESFRNPEAQTPPKPRQMPDFSSITTAIDRIGVMVDRIHKHESEGQITLATLNRIAEQFGVDLVAAVQETKIDSETRARLLDAVERRWASVKLGGR